MESIKQFYSNTYSFKAWLFVSMLFAVVNARADVSWTGVTQSPGDYTSSGIVTITGAVTLNPGTYTFSTLIVNSSRTLTVLSDTTAGTGVTIIANTVTINGTVTGDGKGYSGTSGPGAGTISGTASSGGCHGGFGGLDNTYDFCTTYGDPVSPITLGSPGGMQSSSGPGGGAIKFDVSGTMTVAGTITMNGTDSVAAGVKGGGGAGGSIWIKAAVFAGAGTVRANGSNSANAKGAGGGGRVSINYATTTFSGNATANPGTSSAFWTASEGSVFWIDYVNNDLFIYRSSSISNGTYNFRNMTISSGVTLWNNAHGSKAGVGTGKGTTNGTYYGSGAGYGGRGAYVGVLGGATYGNMLEPTDQGSGGANTGSSNGLGGRGGGAIKLVLTGTLTVDGNLTSNGTDPWWYDDYYPGGGSGGSIWIVADSVAGSGTIAANGGDGAWDASYAYGGVGGGGRIAIYYTTSYSTSLTITAAIGSAGWPDGATPGSAVVINTTTNDLLLPTTSSIQNGTYTYNNITLASNAIVAANEGNAANTGTGKGIANANGGGGGGYGGAGGAGQGGAGGAAYGSSTAPVDLGSGGGGCGTVADGLGGTGGGAIKFVITNNLTINAGAVLSASGGDQINDYYCGGGSGGSIWITAKNINSVSNGIISKGGNGLVRGGGGGGGRIAIYCTGSYSGTLSVAGGTGKNAGSAGSTLVKCSSTPWFFRGY
ncbi:hypothetical protein [Bdellovibrio sp. KM01]|uniref:hypothetical protein n=1 Tax=Bdellovibrio sp. KM01 TaxID=2748865 RepID=UPI0015E9BFB9|nr:hypothetical protein [Bdellovibrio sp. KM01]QLY24841.1 hypothetical protein HW988_15615 [Bdellovibrio sp. KM01]